MGINYHSLGGWSSWQLAIALQAATTATNLDIARRSGLNPSSKSDPSSSLTKTTPEKNGFFNPSFLLRLHMAFAESYSGVAVLPSTA
jgi:hypothetical protein